MIIKKDNRECFNSGRLLGLDLFRIMAVLFVFLFHSHIHIQCQYGFFNEFINMGGIFMTGFYLLSGYALYYVYNKIDLGKIENVKTYYLKRVIGIMPLYYVVAISYVFLLGSETFIQNILLAPIEILGLQSVFTSIFSYTHNVGTWFVSCLLICYLIYPFIQEVAKQIKIKTKLCIIAGSVFVLLWSPFIEGYFSTGSIYANPFFRLLEFLIGIVLCSMKDELESYKKLHLLYSWAAVVLEYVILFMGVTIASKIGIPRNNMLYNWVALPMFMLMIISLSGISNSKINKNRIIEYLCSVSYAFFFAQFYTWKITLKILYIFGTDRNIIKISVSLVVCLLIAILLHEIIEKPLVKGLKNKLLKI